MERIILILLYISAIYTIAAHGEKFKKVINSSDGVLKPSAPRVIDNCPNAEDIAPCTCSMAEEYHRLTMSCSYANSTEMLRNIFRKDFPNNTFYDFYMNQKVISDYIPEEDYFEHVFDVKTFEKIRLNYVDFNMSMDVFDNMTDTLQILEFNVVKFKRFAKDFSKFKKLNTIEILSSRVYDFYVTSPTVEVVRLDHCYLTERSDGLPFYAGKIDNLKYLNVDGNNLNYAPDTSEYTNLETLKYASNSFGGNITFISKDNSTRSYLGYLDIGSNHIYDIEEDSIRLAPNGALRIWKNKITKIEESKYKDIFINARYIYFNGNPLECGCDVAWIVRDPDFMNKLGGLENCADGTDFEDLLVSDYDHCI